MIRAGFFRRTGALVAALLLGLAVTPGQAAASHPQLLQPFFVVADDCWMGYTSGVVSWRAVHPPEPVVVDVRGTVFDRYLYQGGGCVFICAPEVCDDGLATTAYFTAYAGGVEVDAERRRVDNGAEPFRFVLGDSPSFARGPVDEVVIQVCRGPAFSTQPVPPDTYCGERAVFHP